MASTYDERKYSSFFFFFIGCTIIISIPMVYGHMFHEGHLFYIAIHESGFVLASFLTAMAVISYKKTKIKRMLFSSAAFGILAFGQGEVMYRQIDNHIVNNFTSSETLEYYIVAMTVLFAIGIFYKK